MMTTLQTITLIAALLILFLGCWSVIGACWVIYLDMFGGRYDYDKDYPLTRWQLFLAGPVVWWLESNRRKKKGIKND